MNIDELYKKVGKRIKYFRNERGYSQKELALMCDIDKSSITRIESGRTNLTLKSLHIISKQLNVSIMDLVNIEAITTHSDQL